LVRALPLDLSERLRGHALARAASSRSRADPRASTSCILQAREKKNAPGATDRARCAVGTYRKAGQDTMNKQGWLVISAVCTLGSASVAAAHGGHGEGLFQKFDTNQDGVVTTQEVEAAAAAHFAAADTNKDGKLTPEERQAARQERMEEKFEQRDANGNGVLERSEVARMPQPFFDKLDTDKSGTLSPQEMQAIAGLHRHGGKGGHGHGDFGADADRTVTKAEYVAKAKEFMTKLDTNGDGQVSQDEAQAARAQWAHHHFQGQGQGAAGGSSSNGSR
jgi:Ca2+-binding EF-hand superfamily protein